MELSPAGRFCPLVPRYTEAHVGVSLHVSMGASYPRARPALALRHPRGLSEALQATLLAALEQLAANLEGGEMVYQLAIEVGAFLAAHNRKGFGSMAEEMEVRRKEEEARKEQGEQEVEDIRRREMERKVEERRKEIKEEQKMVKEERERSISESEGEVGRRRGRKDSMRQSSVEEEEAVEVVLGVQGRHFTVLRGAPLGPGGAGRTSHLGFVPGTGRPIVVGRWRVAAGVAEDGRQLAALEQELAALVRLAAHPGLVAWLGLAWSRGPEGVEVQVGQELVRGSSLSSLYTSRGARPDLEELRGLSGEVAAALHHLHSSDLVHRSLRCSSVFLEGGVARVADHCLEHRLRDLVGAGRPGRRGKRADVLDLGLVTLSLALGREVAEVETVPTSLPLPLQDFLQHCLAGEERERWGVAALLGHPWLREPLPAEVEVRARSPSPPPPPAPPPPGQEGQSRLSQDFRVLYWIGRGGFGDVVKVRNLLDDQEYAIKRIRLNPADKAVTRKIMREVKLLSRLNHENVVRYYNSWREVTTTAEEVDTTTTTETSSTESRGLVGSFRAPAAVGEVSVEWSSWVPEEEGDSSSEEEEEVVRRVEVEESSGHVVFGGDGRSGSQLWEEAGSEGGSTETESRSSQGPRLRQQHFMYIQMEYCDKQTLRSCIDEQQLHLDMVKVWRMFREMVEGLVHIHTQGIIHRDLKPVNIFIDREDHVKIGDFGLATSGLPGREEEAVVGRSGASAGEELTGGIGTALYVAPELLGGRTSSYNQKVDLYSLGVIFFEMCSPPCSTGMERAQTLGRLRGAAVELPAAWHSETLPQQTFILRWLLHHLPQHRPTSAELAQSDWLPPAQVEERQMQQLVRNTMRNPRAPAYRRLIQACVSQTVAPAKDVHYDCDLPRPSARLAAATEHFLRSAAAAFHLHGAVRVDAPMLLPRTEGGAVAGVEGAVAVMTRGGDTVTLPYDLRVTYARLVARLGTESQRRYSISRVLREEKVFGLHPREGTECAFDIVGPAAGAAMADAEVLVVVAGVVQAADCWTEAKLFYRLSHPHLVAGVLEAAGVVGDLAARVTSGLEGAARGEVAARLAALGVGEQQAAVAAPLLEAEAPLAQLQGVLRVVTRRKGAAAEQAKAALAELRRVETMAASLGLGLEVVGCVRACGGQYSGMTVQLVRERLVKGARRWDVLAAGGRYDALVRRFAANFRLAAGAQEAREGEMVATGVSISADKVHRPVHRQFTCILSRWPRAWPEGRSGGRAWRGGWWGATGRRPPGSPGSSGPGGFIPHTSPRSSASGPVVHLMDVSSIQDHSKLQFILHWTPGKVPGPS